MASGVYSITNRANGHRYVGSAVYIAKRWRSHRSELRRGVHRNVHLQRAWTKYGADAFLFEVLEECAPAMLLDLEQSIIDSEQPAYNICLVAGSSLGRKFGPRSEETKAKISAAQKGRRTGKPAWNRGKSPSAETRAKLSAINKGKKHSAETKAKIAAGNKGLKRQPFTAEHRARLSIALRAFSRRQAGGSSS